MDKVNLAEKFALFSDHWHPRIVGQVQDMYIKIVKVQGEFVWHHHEDEDELFFVVKGRLLLKFRDRDVWLNEGEFMIVPRGVDHLPIGEEETHIMLIEPAGTLNTGSAADSDRTRADLETI